MSGQGFWERRRRRKKLLRALILDLIAGCGAHLFLNRIAEDEKDGCTARFMDLYVKAQ